MPADLPHRSAQAAVTRCAPDWSPIQRGL